MSNTPTPTTTIRVNGRAVEPGTELSIKGEKGRFQYRYPILNEDGDVTGVTVYGGPSGRSTYRSFSLDRIRTVHRITKTRPTQ